MSPHQFEYCNNTRLQFADVSPLSKLILVWEEEQVLVVEQQHEEVQQQEVRDEEKVPEKEKRVTDQRVGDQWEPEVGWEEVLDEHLWEEQLLVVQKEEVLVEVHVGVPREVQHVVQLEEVLY